MAVTQPSPRFHAYAVLELCKRFLTKCRLRFLIVIMLLSCLWTRVVKRVSFILENYLAHNGFKFDSLSTLFWIMGIVR